jgi:hypothetical protein
MEETGCMGALSSWCMEHHTITQANGTTLALLFKLVLESMNETWHIFECHSVR